MRWLVEVMSLGKTETESLHVEAESWQKALQAARERRGESSPMSGFSIELLDEGCRAIDPMSRLRYDVRRAPEETASASVRPPPTTDVPTRQRQVSQPPRPMSHPPSSVKAPHPSKRPSLSPGALSAIGQAPSVRPSATPAPPPYATAAALPSAPVTPALLEPAVSRADVEMNVPSQIVFKREHDPTDAVPLTYREYVFLVPPGTREAAAEALLQTQLELVLASLARVPPGKLVNLGVFDVAYEGKPPVPPLATLMWKDWRGAPVVEFPRRVGYAPTASIAPPTVVAQPIARVSGPSQPPPPVYAPAPQAPSAPPPPAVPLAAPVATLVPPAPPPAPVPVAPAPAPPVAVPAPVAAAAAPLPATAPPVGFARPAAAQSPVQAPRTRVRGEDLISELFESMHDLHFLSDAIEGGAFCLNLAMERIPSQAGLIHLYDIDRREFLVTSTRGAAAKSLLLRRHGEGDVLLAAAMGKRRALVVPDASQSEAAALDRYVVLGGVRSLMVAPVMQSGRFLGAIELLNPLDGQPYTEGEGNALTYIAEQFAEFVASRGVVTDPARIGATAG